MSSSMQKGVVVGLCAFGLLAVVVITLYFVSPGTIGMASGDPETTRELAALTEATASGQPQSQTAEQFVSFMAKANVQAMTPQQRQQVSEMMREQIWRSEEGREAFRQVMENLPEEQHEQIREKMDQLRELTREDREKTGPTPEQVAEREQRRAEMLKRLDEYFEASPEQRKAILDERIDEMQKRRQEWERRRAEREANMTEAEKREREERRSQREQEGQNSDRPSRTDRMVDHMKERIESSDPVVRAKFTEFMNDMRKRMEERGIEPSMRGMRGPR